MKFTKFRSSYVAFRWHRESALLLQFGQYQFGFRVGRPDPRGNRKELRIHAGTYEYIASWGKE